MPDYSDLVPSQLKPAWSDGTDLKPSLTTSNYSGGTPSAANEVKPSLLKSDGSLKASLLDGSSLATSLTSGSASYASVIAGAVGRWLLDDDAASTAVVDTGTGSNNGTLTGAGNTSASSATGPTAGLTKALNFDGSNDYVASIGAVGDYTFIQNDFVFTIAFWMKMASATSRYIIAGSSVTSGDKGWFVSLSRGVGQGTNAIRFNAFNGSSTVINLRTGDNVITDTNWHHIAIRCTAPGDNFLIAVDGVNQSLTYADSFGTAATGDADRVLNIGRANFNSTVVPFGGDLADFVIFDRAITDAEVALLYGGPA